MVIGAKVLALIDGRYNAATDDIDALAADALRHRIGLSFDAHAEAVSADDIVAAAVERAGVETAAEAA